MEQANLRWEWAEVTRGLDNLQQVEANFQGQTLSIPQSAPGAGFVGVALQPTLREAL